MKIVAKFAASIEIVGKVNGRSQWDIRDEAEDRFEKEFGHFTWVVGDFIVTGDTFKLIFVKA